MRSVNEKRMPTLKRKHDDLCQTASAPGEKKLENSPVQDEAPKEMETQKNNSIIDLGKLLSGEKKSIKFNRQGNLRLPKELPCSHER